MEKSVKQRRGNVNEKQRRTSVSGVGATSLLMGLSACGGSGSEPNMTMPPAPPPPQRTTGSVSGIPIRETTVFFDADGDGVVDEDEESQESEGLGRFDLEQVEGVLSATGGVELITGRSLDNIVLRAPDGATVISPLSTLTQAAGARAVVDALFPRLAQVDFLNFDVLDRFEDFHRPGDNLRIVEQRVSSEVILSNQTLMLLFDSVAATAGLENGPEDFDIVVKAVVDAWANTSAAGFNQAFIEEILNQPDLQIDLTASQIGLAAQAISQLIATLQTNTPDALGFFLSRPDPFSDVSLTTVRLAERALLDDLRNLNDATEDEFASRVNSIYAFDRDLIRELLDLRDNPTNAGFPRIYDSQIDGLINTVFQEGRADTEATTFQILGDLREIFGLDPDLPIRILSISVDGVEPTDFDFSLIDATTVRFFVNEGFLGTASVAVELETGDGFNTPISQQTFEVEYLIDGGVVFLPVTVTTLVPGIRTSGLGGADFFFVGENNRRGSLDGGSGDDFLLGGSRSDMISGRTGEDRIFGRGGDDIISGESGDDFIDGGSGKDRILGYRGDDVIRAGSGNDDVYGGEGDDTFLIGRGTGETRLIDFFATGALSIVNDEDGVRSPYSENTSGFFLDDRPIFVGPRFDNFNDVQEWSIVPDFATGRLPDGTLNETSINLLHLNEQADRDFFFADSGEDTIQFEDGLSISTFSLIFEDTDLILGLVESFGPNLDAVDAAARVRLPEWFNDEGAGAAIETWRFETFELDATAIESWASGTEGDDTALTGTAGVDWITGLDGADTISGGGGSDILNGGAGDDIVRGGDGNDILLDIFGNNELFGEAGDDVFILGRNQSNDQTRVIGGEGRDTVVLGDGFTSRHNVVFEDFERNTDQIVFQGVRDENDNQLDFDALLERASLVDGSVSINLDALVTAAGALVEGTLVLQSVASVDDISAQDFVFEADAPWAEDIVFVSDI
ncbi:MAG: calcium-binding protein [Pseudomonadota bacterium]